MRNQIVRYLLFGLLLAGFFLTQSPRLIFAVTESNDIAIRAVRVTTGINTATISWQTDPATKSKVEYADTLGIWKETPWAENFRTEHSFTLLNLKADSTYLYRISAEDSNGALKTTTDKLVTLKDDNVLGVQEETTGQGAGFQDLLNAFSTPSPTPTPGLNYSNILGTQIPYIPILALPLAYQPLLQTPTTAPSPVISQPIENPTPTPTPANGLIGSSTATTMLLIGLVCGILVAYLLHQISASKNGAKENLVNPTPNRETNSETPTKPRDPNLPNSFQFTVESK